MKGEGGGGRLARGSHLYRAAWTCPVQRRAHLPNHAVKLKEGVTDGTLEPINPADK